MEEALKQKKIRDAVDTKKALEGKLEFLNEELKSMSPDL